MTALGNGLRYAVDEALVTLSCIMPVEPEDGKKKWVSIRGWLARGACFGSTLGG